MSISVDSTSLVVAVFERISVIHLADFSFRIKKFPRPHVAYSNQIRLATRIRWYMDSLGETRPTRCTAILVYCSVIDWTRFCYAIGFQSIRIHLPLFFSTLLSGLKKKTGFAAEFAGCVCTEAVSGKKKLRIRSEYPDKSGRVLSAFKFSFVGMGFSHANLSSCESGVILSGLKKSTFFDL